ncbi:MAG TPA: PGPGW domain-containing protein [Planctomycetaceae bacterium]
MPLIKPSELPEQSDRPASAARYRSSALCLARRIVVLVLGISVVLAGIVMIVTPGPAVVVIPMGLGILATEFLWARRILDMMKARLAAGQEMLPDSPVSNWLKHWLPRNPGCS